MVTRFIDALDAGNVVVATHTETNDAIMSWDIPTIFPSLTPGVTYNFVMRTGETAGYTVPVNTLLDLVSVSAAAAYGLRRLRTAHAGSAIRVRRSSDNLEADIGFNANGSLNTTALLAHCGAGSGFVVTWYDQSGNGRDVTQATQANQPRIVNAGTVDTVNSRPTIVFNGTSHHLFRTASIMTAAGPGTYSLVASGAAQSGGYLITEGISTGPEILFGPIASSVAATANGRAFFRDSLNSIRFDSDVSLSATFNPNLFTSALRVMSHRYDGSLVEGFNNGTRGATSTFTMGANFATANRFAIGALVRNTVSGYFAGNISEVIIYTSALSNTDFNAMTASQGEGYGITVLPFLSEAQRLAIANGTGDGGSSLAVNLGGGGDDFDPIYLDRARGARRFLNGNNFDPVPDANLTAERYLASLPAGQSQVRFFFSAYDRNDPSKVTQGPDYSGRFQFKILQGAASSVGFSNAGTNVVQIDATTWEFDCNWNGNLWVQITPTAFPFRVSLIRTSDLAAVAAGEVFTPDYKNQFVSNSTVRLLNMFRTNVPPTGLTALNDRTTWASWPQLNWQNERPLAPMVAIFNEKMTHPWFCVHHNADDDHITQLATYLRDNLNPALKIRFELSNEIWNTFAFRQGLHFKALAESVWGVPNGYADSLWLHYAGKRFVQMMNIINGVFAGQTNRVIGVIAGQAAGDAGNFAMLDALSWQTYEPGSYVPPHTRAKEYSIAPYINYTHDKFTTAANNEAAAIKTQLDISVAAAANYIRTNLIPPGLSNAKAQIDAAVILAGGRDLRLTIYEYNNHFDLFHFEGSVLYTGSVPVPGAVDAFRQANHSQEMADAQDELRDYAKSKGVSVMAFFQDLGPSTQFGSWGAKGHHQHNSVIWNDLLAWHTANPRWWAQ